MKHRTSQPAHVAVRHPVLPALPPADPFVSIPQAARIIGISDFIVDRLIEQGKLPEPIRHTEGGRRYFRLSTVQAYIKSLVKKAVRP